MKADDDTIRPDNVARTIESGRSKRPPPMATCPRDGAPLICTLAFSGAEFYCLECGRTFGFMAPAPAVETPELTKQYEALKAEWDEITDGGKALIGGGVRLKSCDACTEKGEPHVYHATAAELAKHEAALAKLHERAA